MRHALWPCDTYTRYKVVHVDAPRKPSEAYRCTNCGVSYDANYASLTKEDAASTPRLRLHTHRAG